MALAKSKTTLGTPGVDTNFGEQIKEQNQDRRETGEFNKGLVESGASYDPKTQVADTSGYYQAKQKYNQYLKDYSDYAANIAKNASISLNKDTGKITVNAPSLALQNPTFKKSIEPALEAISQNYKVNHDYKYALMNNTDETKTSEEWVEELNKDLEGLVRNAMAFEKTKQEVKEATGVEYSDEDVATRAAVAIEYKGSDGQTVKVKDDTMQALPKVIKNLNVFKNLEGYDENSQMVSYGNLMKMWDREVNKDSDILEVFNEVDAYFQRGDFSDPSEHAAMSAFAEFINNKDPNISFWGGAAETIGQTIYGVITGAETFWAETFANVETLFNNVGEFSEWLGRQTTGRGDEPSKYKKMNFWNRDVLRPFNEWKDENRKNLARLNDSASTMYSLTDALTPAAIELCVSVGLGNAAADFVKDASTTRMIKSMYKKYNTTAEELTKLTASNIASGAVSAEELAKGIYVGTDVIMQLQSAENFAKIANAAIKSTAVIQKTIGFTSKVADVLAQAVTDVVLSDPKMFRRLMETGDNESRAYAIEQLTQNVAGEIAGATLIKGVTSFGSTDTAKVLNARISPAIYDIKSRIGQASEDLKTAIFHHGNSDWLVEKTKKLSDAAEAAKGKGYFQEKFAWNRAARYERKLQNLGERQILRQAGKELGEFAEENPVVGDTWEETVKAANKVNIEKASLMSKANLAINAVYRQDVSALVAKFMQDDSKLKGSLDAFLESQANVIKVENSLGLGKDYKVFDLGDGKTTRVLDKATNEYVVAGYRIKIAEAIRDYSDIPENVKRAKKEIEYFEAITKDFEATKPQELVDAAKDLRQKAIDLSGATQDLRIQQTVMSSEELARMRKSGYFDEGYMRTQRIKDWQTYRNNGKVKVSELRDVESFKLGSQDPFQDVALTLVDDINEVARQVNRKHAVDMLRDIGFPVKTVVSGDEVRVVKEVNQKARNKVVKDIQKTTDNLVKDTSSNLYNEAFARSQARSVVATQEVETMEAGGKVAAARASDLPKVTRTDRHLLFSEYLNESDIDDLILSDPRSAFNVPVTDEESFQKFYNSLDNGTKKWLRGKMTEEYGHLYGDFPKRGKKITPKKGDIISFENFQRLDSYDPDMVNQLKRVYAERNFGDAFDEQIAVAKKRQRVLDRERIFRDNQTRLNKIYKDYDLPAMDDLVDDEIDDFIETAIDVNSTNKTIDEVFESMATGTAGKEDLIEYATLESLYKNRKKVEGGFFTRAKSDFNEKLTKYYKEKFKDDKKKLSKALAGVDRQAESLANETSAMLIDRIEQRYGEVSSRLMRQGSSIPDQKYLFQHIDELNKDITGAKAADNVIKTYDAYGLEEYVEISPTVANMFTTMPRQIRRGPFGQIQQAFCRTFRIGTTGGLVPGSLVNQAFRDTGNALMIGDAWKSSQEVEEELTRLFGERFAKEYQETVPDVFDTLLKQAEETGEDVNRLIVKREMERGALNVESELETNLYQFGREGRQARRAGGMYTQTRMDKFNDGLDKVIEKTDTLNNIRETALRKRVYNNNLLKGMKEGMSLEEARNLAEFMQSEATTNFIRQSYHLANLSKTVPYLGSAINGAKSFWRLYAFDPVGITTRIVGGYVVPVIALTNMSLADEESRRIYKQIPEYEKANNMVFVINGQIFSIPVPQEISSFVTPAQHMVESLQGASENSFGELIANDLLGAFPIDLSGFLNIDSTSLLEEDIFSHNLIPGFAKVSSTLMDPLTKSAFMMATGVDPYTMKAIQRNNVDVDNQTGEQYIMDQHTSETAKFIGSIAGDFMSAPMAQKVLQNIIGKGGIMISDGISQLVQAVVDKDNAFAHLGSAGQVVLENASKNLTVERYGEESNIAWNRTAAQLFSEKNELLGGQTEKSKKYLADVKLLNSSDASEDAKKAASSRVKTIQQEFMQKVLDAANNLVSKYDGTFDRYKFTTVLSLMNLDSGSVNELPFNKYATYLDKQDWNVNKAAAVETMARMGFSAPNDGSIFGYYKENDDGSITIQYNSPINILNYNLSSQQQNNIAFADIQSIISEKGLYDKMQEYEKQIQAIYSKKKLSKQDRANIEQLQINWNAEVAKEIAPVVSKMTAEAAINNKRVRDLLYTYIYVPDSYKVNNKGRFVSLGDDGSGKAAYYQSWIKRMFGVNDKYKGQY